MGLRIELVEILENRQVGLGDRCCIDLIGRFSATEGLLVGMSSKGYFMVYNERKGSLFSSPRPFRVNAGPVSAYTLVPGNGKGYMTKYLSELYSGDKVLVFDCKGHEEKIKIGKNTREVEVGRNKIETRPLLFIRAKSKTLSERSAMKKLRGMAKGQDELQIFLQNAETISLVNDKKKPIRASQVEPGDRVLACVANPHPMGRHFGMAITHEFILER